MHFNLDDTVTAAGFTSAAFYVKTESTLFIASRLGIRRRRKQIPDLIKQTCIRGRVGTRRSADRRLVNIDHFVELLDPLDCLMLTRNRQGMVEIMCQPLIYDLIDKRRFSGTGYTGHTCHDTKRDLHVDIFQVVFRRTDYLKVTGCTFSHFRNRDLHDSAQILSGHRFRYLHDILCCSGCNHFSAMTARSGTDIHNPVCFPHRILVMFHNDQCISQIPQIFECCKQLIIIPLMQSDTRLIQNITYTDKPRSDLCRQTDTLCFPTGQRCSRSGKRQIFQSYIHQKSYSCTDFLQDPFPDQFLLFRQLQLTEKIMQCFDRHRSNFINIFICDRHSKRFFFQPHTTTGLTRRDTHESFIFLFDRFRSGLSVSSVDILDQTFKSNRIYTLSALPFVINVNLFAVCSMQQDRSDLFRIVAERSIQIKAIPFCKCM